MQLRKGKRKQFTTYFPTYYTKDGVHENVNIFYSKGVWYSNAELENYNGLYTESKIYSFQTNWKEFKENLRRDPHIIWFQSDLKIPKYIFRIK